MRNRKRRVKGKWSKKVRKARRPSYNVMIRNMYYSKKTKEFVYEYKYTGDCECYVPFNTARKANNYARHLTDKYDVLVDIKKIYWEKNMRWQSGSTWYPTDRRWNEKNLLVAGDYITLLRKMSSAYCDPRRRI